MSLKFYFGPSGSGKSTRMQEDILAIMEQEPGRHICVLTPDQNTMQTQMQLIKRSKNKGLMNIDILSFSRLAYRIFEELGTADRVMLDDTGKNLILRRVAMENADKLLVLGRNLNKSGYIHEIKSAISEFMQYGLSDKDVLELIDYAKDKPLLSRKLSDLRVLYDAFRRYIDEKYLTTEERLELLARELPKSELMSDSIVIFDGFTGFTPVQNKVIAAIMSCASQVWMSFTVDEKAIKDVDSDNAEDGLFGLTLRSIKSMTKLAKECGITMEPAVTLFESCTARYQDNHMLNHLEKQIFRYPYSTYEGGDAIRIFSENTPREELVSVAIQIRRLIQERQYAYRDFAIVTGDMERYEPYAKQVFDMYQIPCFMDSNKGLSLNPFTEYIKSALMIINTNYSYEAVIHFLRSGLTGIANEDIDCFENYLRALGIRGAKKYSDDFVKYAHYMQERDERGKLSVTDRSISMLARVNDIRARLMQMLEHIRGYNASGKYAANKITNDVYLFITSNESYEKLCRYRDRFEESGDHVRVREYSQVYEKIMNLLEQMSELLGDDELTMSEYLKIFEAGLTEIKIGVLPPGVDICTMGDIQRTRLTDIKCLFFIGLNDGVIPGSGGNGGIISDIDREYLVESGHELAPSPRQQMYIQKLYLYMLVSSPSKLLYLSYAKADNKGQALRPSYFVSSVKKLFPGLKEMQIREAEALMNLYGYRDSMVTLSDMLREYARRNLDDARIAEMASLFKVIKGMSDSEYGDMAHELVDAAFIRHEEQMLARELVKTLYGVALANSISRLEGFAACAYSHFLKYGLKLSEREEYSFDSMDMGNLYHLILEEYGNTLKEKGLMWRDVDETLARDLLDSIIRKHTASYGESVIFDSSRSEYAISRLKRILLRTVLAVKYQLAKSSFNPDRFEHKFVHEMDAKNLKVELTDEDRMFINGKIDRIDTAKDGDKLYVKVVDYKSSGHKIDLIQLYQGLQLQLVVYLDQACKVEKKSHPNMNVIPAAMFYYHVNDPIIEDGNYTTAEEINSEIQKKLMVSGLISADKDIVEKLDNTIDGKSDVINVSFNKDGSFAKSSQVMDEDRLDVIMHYAGHKMAKLGKDILSGNIEPRPCSQDTCKWCSYKGICEFDTTIDGYEYANIPSMSDDDVIAKMKEELDG